MLLNLLLTVAQRAAKNVVRIAARLAGVIVFATVLVVPIASAQTDYSDAWVDDSNPDAGVIVGAGVTENDYSADAIAVETTLTSVVRAVSI